MSVPIQTDDRSLRVASSGSKNSSGLNAACSVGKVASNRSFENADSRGRHLPCMLRHPIQAAMVGFASHSVLRTNPTVAKLVGRVSGVAMIIVAIALISEQYAL